MGLQECLRLLDEYDRNLDEPDRARREAVRLDLVRRMELLWPRMTRAEMAAQEARQFDLYQRRVRTP